MIRRIRYSEVRAWKRCRRNWLVSYQMGLARESDAPSTADVGTLVHIGVQTHYEGHSNEACHVAIDVNRTEQHEGKKWDSTFELAHVMVDGYFDWLEETGADADYEPVAVERRIEASFGDILGDEVILTGQMDLLHRHVPSGLIYLRDTKTVQSLEQVGRRLQLDDQLLTYAVLLRLQGIKVAGAEHNNLRRVLRSASAKPPFYGRSQVQFNDTQLRNHHTHLMGTLTEMVRAYQALEADPDTHHAVAPPTPSDFCSWGCSAPGIDGCLLSDDGADFAGFLRDTFVPNPQARPS